MAKKHKHEEHVNHERWLVSFADMMTLLFALFVVLYSLGQANQSKMKEVKNSIQWAFHIAGQGKTNDIGIVDQVSGGGDVAAAAPPGERCRRWVGSRGGTRVAAAAEGRRAAG